MSALVPAPLSRTDIARIWRETTGGTQMDQCAEEFARRIERAAVEASAAPDQLEALQASPNHAYVTEINRLRNVIQAACSGGLDHMVERWKQLFPDAPVPTVRPRVVWPMARDVGRLHDMSPAGHLRVGLDGDSDVFVEVFNDQQEALASVEFCTPGAGGGRSSRTRLALIALMVAMEADNADRPDLDWWARRGVKPDGTKGGAAA